MAVNINVPSQVKTYANLAAFPASGALKTIYIAEDTNKTYRWTGSVYVEVSAAGATGITIGTTAITSGTVGRVLFEGTGNVVQESANLFWDNTNGRLGIGTSSPSAVVHSVGSVTASGAIARANFLNNTLVAAANSDTLVGLDINSTFTNGAFTGVSNLLLRASIAGTTKASITTLGDLILNGVTGANSPSVSVFTSGTSAYFQNYYNPTDNALYWQSVGSYHSATKMVFRNFQQNTGFVVFSNGNTALGSNPATVADAGFRLDVNGTARVATTLTVGSTSGAGLVNITRSDGGIMTTINSPDACTINNLNGNGVRINVDSVNYFHVRGFASQFAVNVTGALTSNAGFTRALLVNNVINANANNVELAAVYISPTFNNLAFTGVKNIAIQSASGGAHFNTTSVDVSSILQADSTTKGFLPPRMTTTQKNAIASPATGLMVYDTTLNLISVYNGTTWITL